MKNFIRNGRLVVALAASALLLVPSPGTTQAALHAYGAEHGYVLYARAAATSAAGTASARPYFIGYGPIKNAYKEGFPNTSIRCLDAELTSAYNPDQNGDYVQIWECNGDANQNWTFVDLGNGWYKILNGYGNHSALVAENDKIDNPSSNGDTVWMWNYIGTCEQQWKPETVRGSPGSNDYLAKIVNKCAGKVLDAEDDPFNNPLKNGDRVQLWSYGGGYNQKWHG